MVEITLTEQFYNENSYTRKYEYFKEPIYLLDGNAVTKDGHILFKTLSAYHFQLKTNPTLL